MGCYKTFQIRHSGKVGWLSNDYTIRHNDYPLAPEKIAVTNDMLSKYCKSIADKYEIKVGDVKKLIPNLDHKNKYVPHYKNLQFIFRNETNKNS